MKHSFPFAILALLLGASACFAEPLLLGPGDVVRLSVMNREDILSGEFTVEPDGTISLHILGRTQAAGLGIAEFEAAIETALTERLQLPVSLTAQVAEWRPVYVLGDVDTPGQYAFRPGLSVQKMVALAGGLFPRGGETLSSVDFRLADETANLAQLRQKLASRLVSLARLRAELDGSTVITLPEEVADLMPGGESLVAEQQAILVRQLASIESRVAAAQKRSALADGEARSLQGQQDLLSEQIAEDEAATADLRRLLEQGLAQSERVRQLQRGLNEAKIERMLASTYEARAQQEKAAADALIEEITAERQREIAQEMASLSVEERQLRTQIEASESILAQFGAGRPAATGGIDLAPPDYRIVRAVEGQPDAVLDAGPTDAVMPGDLIEVQRGGWEAP